MAPQTAVRKKKNQGQMASDPLSREQLAAQYGFALRVIYSDPELAKLFEDAVSQGWNAQLFQTSLQNTNWYQTNNEYARKAWTAERMGGADWQASLTDARNTVRQEAVKVGADLSDQEAESLARQYLYGGYHRLPIERKAEA